MSVVPMQQVDPTAVAVERAAEVLSRPPQVTTEVAHEALTPQFAHTANTLAGKAAMAQSAAEAKDFADAALKLVQAIITLDPMRLAGGDTAETRKASMPEPPRPPATSPGTRDRDHDGRIGE